MEQHAEALPDLAPMLATAGALPRGDGWVVEVKWDGVRALLGVRPDGSHRITSRLGNDSTGAFPELAGLAASVRDAGLSVLLDGEIVAFGPEGKPSFSMLQQRLGLAPAAAVRRAREIPVVYVVFDLLHLNGLSTRSLPWTARRSLLERVWPGDGPSWRLSSTYDDGPALLDAIRAADMEGVVAKRRDAPYTAGRRSPAWIKVKHLNVDEVVIGGWVPGDRSRPRRSAH